MAINLEQGGEGTIETLQSTNQLNGKVLSFNNYKNIQVEFPSGFSTDISASNFKMLSYAFDSQESSLISPVIEISLLSSSSENIKVENLNNRIKLKFTGLFLSRDAPTLVNATCVYFDTTSQTWISSGLSSQINIVKSEGGKVYFDLECQSSHLTSFSIQELPSIVQRNTSTTTNTDSTTTIILAVVIPVSLLLIAAVIVVIATIIGLVAYFKKREERIKLNNSASNTNNMQELQYLSGNIDFPSNESMFYKPLMSIRADSDTGSLDRSTSFDPLSRYTDLVRIGQGAFGSVFKANDSKNEGKVKALKVIKYSSFEELNNIMKEGTQLMNIEHPNILKVNEVFVNQDQLLIIDMDFYEMGDLTKLTDASFICSEPLIKKILYQMCSALDYVHTVKKMIHRDIKPSNIFIKSLSHDDIQVIIADFGLAKQSQGSIQNSYAGTPLFMSPELAVGGKYNSNTDMYSLGVAIFQIMTKDTSSSISEQYLTKDPNQVIQWLTERMEEPKLYSKELIQIILSMLNKNSVDRPHADSIIRLPYFQ